MPETDEVMFMAVGMMVSVTVKEEVSSEMLCDSRVLESVAEADAVAPSTASVELTVSDAPSLQGVVSNP